jgi:two-component system, cell cycle response regulator DivK
MSHVLVAEDSADDLELFTSFLRMDGHIVTGVKTTEALLSSVFSVSPPDVLLLDLILDRANGLEVVQTLRADSRSATLPIVAITAATPRYIEDVALRAGCTAFLTKPCTPDDVSQVLREAILSRRR